MDTQYKDFVKRIMVEGTHRGDRTGTGTISKFGEKMEFDVNLKSFPIQTSKKIYWPGVMHELLWFISGDTNTKYLTDNNVNIWNEWADENGNLGPVYGKQWRDWQSIHSCTDMDRQLGMDTGEFLGSTPPDATGYYQESFDQLQQAVDDIKNNPESRRIIVNAWNVGDLSKMALPPCHMFFQFYTRKITMSDTITKLPYCMDEKVAMHIGMVLAATGDKGYEVLRKQGLPTRILDVQLYQRSADAFLGVPFNISSYSLLLAMVAQVTGTIPGKLHHVIGDAHIYSNHFDQVQAMLDQEQLTLPELRLDKSITSIDDFTADNIELINYQHGPHIPAPVAV